MKYILLHITLFYSFLFIEVYLIKPNFNIKMNQINYYFLILIAFLITTSLILQVTANFTIVDSITTCGSLVVRFQDV